MAFDEDDFLAISGIQHFRYCRRRWALIHIENQWSENIHTVLGGIAHEKAHDPFIVEKRGDILIVRALPISSKRLGISGECDIVEFQKAAEGISLRGYLDTYNIYPVEYKKGNRKINEEYVYQLVGQALCLEEMFSTKISRGALYYAANHRRTEIDITDELKSEVEKIIQEMHHYIQRGYTPKVKPDKRCRKCSLVDLCLPELEKTISVQKFIENNLREESAS